MIDYIAGELKREKEVHRTKVVTADDWKKESTEFGDRLLGALRRVVTDEMATAHARGLCLHQTVSGLCSAVAQLVQDTDAVYKLLVLSAAVGGEQIGEAVLKERRE